MLSLNCAAGIESSSSSMDDVDPNSRLQAYNVRVDELQILSMTFTERLSSDRQKPLLVLLYKAAREERRLKTYAV